MAGLLALLAGLFVAPLLLAWLGHRWRDRSARQKSTFWGGLLGHSAGMLLALLLSLAPPIVWTGGSAWRDVGLHWGMIGGFALGAAVGALRGRGEPAVDDAASAPRDAARAAG